jgi:hypothetical protein
MPGKLVSIANRMAYNGNCDTAPDTMASSSKSVRYSDHNRHCGKYQRKKS